VFVINAIKRCGKMSIIWDGSDAYV
jgi:hypothetical protein